MQTSILVYGSRSVSVSRYVVGRYVPSTNAELDRFLGIRAKVKILLISNLVINYYYFDFSFSMSAQSREHYTPLAGTDTYTFTIFIHIELTHTAHTYKFITTYKLKIVCN